MSVTIGAALNYENTKLLKDWLFDDARPLEIQDFVPTEVASDPQEDLVAAYKKLLDGYEGEFGVHGPFWGLDISTADSEIAALVTKRLLTCLEKVEALGGTHMVVHSPFVGFNEWNRWNYPDMLPQMFDACTKVLSPVLARARDIGCVLMLENIADVNPLTRVELCRALGTDAIRVSVDTGHAALAHGTSGAPAVADFITAAAADLGHVHLQDADGFADRHWHPGEGNLPWTGIARAIVEGGGNPRLILEVRDRQHLLPKTAEWLDARFRDAA